MGKRTDIEDSNVEMEIEVNAENMNGGYGKSVNLSELPTLTPFQRGVCEVKVVRVDGEMVASGGKISLLVIVQGLVDPQCGIEEQECYRLKGVIKSLGRRSF